MSTRVMVDRMVDKMIDTLDGIQNYSRQMAVDTYKMMADRMTDRQDATDLVLLPTPLDCGVTPRGGAPGPWPDIFMC